MKNTGRITDMIAVDSFGHIESKPICGFSAASASIESNGE